MGKRFQAILASAALLAGCLTGCTGVNSITVITPSTATGGTGVQSQVQTLPAGETSSALTPPSAALQDTQEETENAWQQQTAQAFAAAFATRQSQVIAALRGVPEPQTEASEPAEDAAPVGTAYAVQADTAVLDCGADGNLTCLLGCATLTLLEGTELACTLELSQSEPGLTRMPRQVLLSGTVLAVVYGLWDDQPADLHRTEVEFYDVSDPKEPVFTAFQGLDGDYLSGELDSGRLYLTTCWTPQAQSPRLPCRYGAQGAESISAGQVLLPAQLDRLDMTLYAVYNAATGEPESWFAAAGADVVTRLTDGSAAVGWQQTVQDQKTWQQSVYDVTQTTSYHRTGLVLVRPLDGVWLFMTATSVPGWPQLLAGGGALLTLVTDTFSQATAAYRDPAFGWTVEQPEEPATGSCLLTLDGGLHTLDELALSDGQPVTLLGLWDTTLYYITGEDSLLRAAGISEPDQLLAAPLAEVAGFADLLVLAEGRVVGLQRLDPANPESPLELVTLNVSNPAHITRKYPDGKALPAGTRFVPTEGAFAGSLLAAADGVWASVYRQSSLYGLIRMNALDATLLGSGLELQTCQSLLCLTGSQGFALLEQETGQVLYP